MDFSLSRTQEELKKSARAFARAKLNDNIINEKKNTRTKILRILQIGKNPQKYFFTPMTKKSVLKTNDPIIKARI